MIKDGIVINVVEADERFMNYLVQHRQCDLGVQTDTLNIGDTYTPSIPQKTDIEILQEENEELKESLLQTQAAVDFILFNF